MPTCPSHGQRARDADKAALAAGEMGAELDIAADAVMSADIVVTTTPSTTPLVNAEWLIPGQHITAMGSDQAHKNELAPACLARADLYVPDRRSQTEKLGELHHALAAWEYRTYWEDHVDVKYHKIKDLRAFSRIYITGNKAASSWLGKSTPPQIRMREETLLHSSPPVFGSDNRHTNFHQDGPIWIRSRHSGLHWY